MHYKLEYCETISYMHYTCRLDNGDDHVDLRIFHRP